MEELKEDIDFEKLVLLIPKIMEKFEKISCNYASTNKKFLKLSKQDLHSSKILYESNDYRNSIYLLQQSVEKLSKYFVLFLGFEKENKLKKISHFTPLVFSKLIFKESIELSNALGYKMNSETNFEEQIRNSRETLSNISENSILVFLKTIKNTDDTFNNHFLFKENKELCNFISMIMRIYLLGVLTYPYVNNTRYLDSNLIFDEKTPIVKTYDKIIDEVQTTLDMIDNLEVSENE